MLNLAKKKAQVERLKTHFSRAKASFLVNCIGLEVQQITELRKSLKKSQGDLQVIRNSLSLLAMSGSEILKKTYTPFMEGPNSFVLAFEDPAQVAKLIDQFSEDYPAFQIKSAVLDGSALSPAEVKTLAKLPSIEVLRSSFLRTLASPLSRFLFTVQEVPGGFVRLLSAKKGEKA